MLMKRVIIFTIFCIVFAAGCNNNSIDKKDTSTEQKNDPELISYSVVKSFPHDTNSFTEGFVAHNGQLFESTGHTDSYASSRSLFGILDTSTGKIDVKAEIDKKKYFGEGIVFFKNKIYQLTDTTRVGFVYDAKTYKLLNEFHYTGDGWALTTDGKHLIMSNGSSNIVYRDAESFGIVKTLNVTDDNGPVSNINELELINSFIYANQWLTNYILKIDTASGKVVGKLDLSAQAAEVKSVYNGSEEMNGIAFDAAADKIYVTGKLWPRIYEIKFNH
jgi:glutamine cyclotransferase